MMSAKPPINPYKPVLSFLVNPLRWQGRDLGAMVTMNQSSTEGGMPGFYLTLTPDEVSELALSLVSGSPFEKIINTPEHSVMIVKSDAPWWRRWWRW